MIVNELLNYVYHYIDKSAIVLNFYTVNEVTEAKKCIWQNFKDHLESYSERKSTEKRSAKDANLDDIFKALKALDEGEVSCEFVSKDLSRLPSVNPEELNTTFLLERVTSIEKRLADYEKVLSNQRVDFLKLQDNVQDLVESKNDDNCSNNNNGSLSPDCTKLKFCNNFNKVLKNNNTESNVKSLIEKFNNGNLEITKKKRHYSDGAVVLNKTLNFFDTKINKTINEAVPISEVKENRDVYDFVKNEINVSTCNSTPRFCNLSDLNPNLIRSGVFYSRKNSDANRKLVGGSFSRIKNFGSHLRGAVNNYQVTKDIFVYRVAEGSITDVRNYCTRNGIRNFKVVLTSHSNSKFKSFKLTVRSFDFEKVIKTNFWPKGVYCKPFINIK